MNEMVERVARALWRCSNDGASWLAEEEEVPLLYRGLARAAIAAMREPRNRFVDSKKTQEMNMSEPVPTREEIEALVAELRNGFSLSGSGKPRFPVPVMERAADYLLTLSRQLEECGEAYGRDTTSLAKERNAAYERAERAEAERDAAYAEGAEAMREAAAQKAEAESERCLMLENHPETSSDARARYAARWTSAKDIVYSIRALPLPQRR